MADQFTEVTSESWFSRIAGSIKSVLVGLLFFVLSFPLLWCNEGRAVTTAKSLAEGAAAVVSVASAQASPGNDGRLVHMSGKATTDEVLSDQQFGMSATAIKLRRTVEMYQWQEEQRTEERKKVGGGTEKTTTYSYDTVWSESHIDSSGFRQAEGHGNPASMPWTTEHHTAETVTLGAFTLSDGLVRQITAWEPLAVREVPPGAPAGLKVTGSRFYIGDDPDRPAVGDLRIRFDMVPASTVSVIARQQGSGLIPYQTKAGRALEMLELGVHAADQMFQAAMSRNTMLTWILRAVGFLVMFIGVLTIFKPLAVVADVVPLFGTILRGGIGFFAFVIAMPLSLVVIAVAWVVYRPLLGITLLVVAVGLIVGAVMLVKKRKPKLPPLPT